MANVCERCKRSMSSHDNHASCPQCRMAAGECSLDSENPCTICKEWTLRQWGKLRRSLVDARARSCQQGRQHWSAAFPRLEAWILSKPVSTSASEISSQAGEGDFEDDTLVSMPIQQSQQVLVVQAQNGVNMASGTATWHSSTIPVADMNQDIVRGKFNKSLKPQDPSKPWSPKDFFGGSGYYVHNTQGYLAKPDSLVLPSRPPPAERTAEDQPFFHVPRNPEDPRTRVDISSGSASLTASQLIDQEAMSRKSAAAASTALSLAEFIDNYPGMPEGARAAMLLLKLDIVSYLHYAWREVHYKILLRRSIALDCLERTLPPIDEDQKLALLHAPFKGTTLFGGELAKLQEANTKRAATFTVFPQPTAPSTSYSTRPYVGRGKSFKDKKGFKRPGGTWQGTGQVRAFRHDYETWPI